MDTSSIAIWISANSFWIIGIVVFCYVGYKLFELYLKNKKKIDKNLAIIKKSLKGGKQKDAVETNEES